MNLCITNPTSRKLWFYRKEAMDILSGKCLVNERATVVVEALCGAVIGNSSLGLLDFGNVIVRRDYLSVDKVKIISGGGAGHDPAYSGFVGKGMLTAAIHGDIFSSPPAKIILRTIKELALKQPDTGVLLIVRNTSGNRLSFGLAKERAINDGIKVQLLTVDDDCHKSDTDTDRRGLTGLAIICKIAGAMSEENKNLDEIFALCQQVLQQMSSITLCLNPCISPPTQSCACVKYKNNEIEIGTGLHGEPGFKKTRLTKLSDICRSLIQEMTSGSEAFVLDETSPPVVLLINNLGTLSKTEELLFLREFVSQLHSSQVKISRMYCGRYYTSLNMAGLSVTILKVDSVEIIQYLDAPCETSGWSETTAKDILPNAEERLPATVKKYARNTPSLQGPKLDGRQANILCLVTQFACDALVSCEKQLNTIDSERGDGDTGSRIRQGAEAILRELSLKRLKTTHPFTFFEYISRLLEVTMGGVLGNIYSIFFEAAAKPFLNLPEEYVADVNIWLRSLESANDAVKTYTNAEVGNHTMYDPLYMCATTITTALNQSVKPMEAFGIGVSAAEESAQKTKLLGKRYPDPGAHAVGIWMRAVYEGVKLRYSDD